MRCCPSIMVTALGTSALTVGIIEGIAEATASITKIFSGALSDWLGKRKLLAAFGYGLAAFTKPIFPLRALDRMADRGALRRSRRQGHPRRATRCARRRHRPAHLRGASFGLRQSLDTVGAFLGPLLAIGLMWLTADHFQAVFWIAVIPAFLSLGLILVAVQRAGAPEGPTPGSHPSASRRTLPSRRGLLVGRGGRDGLYAGPFQRSLPRPARAIDRPAAGAGPDGAGDHDIAYSMSAFPIGVLSDRVIA